MPECDTKPEGIEGTVEAFCEWKGDHDAKVAAIEARLQKAKDRNAAGSAARAEDDAEEQIPSEKWKEEHKEKTDAQCERIQIGCSEDTQSCEGDWPAGAGDSSGPYLAFLPRAEAISPKQAQRDDVQPPVEMFWWQGSSPMVVSDVFLKWCGNHFSSIYPYPMWTGVGMGSGLYSTREEALATHPLPFRMMYNYSWTHFATLEEAKPYAIQEANGVRVHNSVYEYHGEGGMPTDNSGFIVWTTEEAQQVDQSCDPESPPAFEAEAEADGQGGTTGRTWCVRCADGQCP